MSPTITAVERRRRGVVAVTLDGGGDPLLLPIDDVVAHAVRAGRHFDDAEWSELSRRGQERLAVRKGLELLARRARTAADLRQALLRQFTEPAVDGALRRLAEVGYVDDATWAEHYVDSARAGVRGARLLRQELRRHGVEDHDIAGALDRHDDRAAALRAGRRRLPGLVRLDEERRRRRLYGLLARRGFDSALVRSVSDELLADLPPPPPQDAP